MPLGPGDPVPRATLTAHDGAELTVPVEGRVTVLVLYRGDW